MSQIGRCQRWVIMLKWFGTDGKRKILLLEADLTFRPDPSLKDAFEQWEVAHQQAADADGGMREAGVEMLLAHEIDGVSADYMMMKLFN